MIIFIQVQGKAAVMVRVSFTSNFRVSLQVALVSLRVIKNWLFYLAKFCEATKTVKTTIISVSIARRKIRFNHAQLLRNISKQWPWFMASRRKHSVPSIPYLQGCGYGAERLIINVG